MGIFTNLYCPLCGSNKPVSSFQKPYKKMPFARVLESLGRASLRTIQVITSPFKIDLTLIKNRLLLTVKNWYELGIITDDDVDRYLCDIISEFNERTREMQYVNTALKGYAKPKPVTYFFREKETEEGTEELSKPTYTYKDNTSVKRVRKSWL